MQSKCVIFIADSLDNAHKFRSVLTGLGVEVWAGSSLQFKNLLSQHPCCDLVVYEARGGADDLLPGVGAMLQEEGVGALLAIVDEGRLEAMSLPSQVKSDFVVHGASARECGARIRRLLHSGGECSSVECLVVGDMTLNLATYQVTLAGEPLDFTYLEYALLVFLLTHPGRTYSRDALLRCVWGFDYYGGSRTVDVHVRRIRAKLGPDLAQHLETVRGVGYLWSA